MGISDKIDDSRIGIDGMTVLKRIKRRFDLEGIFRNHRLTSKFCSVNHLKIIECFGFHRG